MYGYHFVSETLNTFEDTFEDTEMCTFKHEPFCIVGNRSRGGGGRSLFVVLYGIIPSPAHIKNLIKAFKLET